MLWERLKENGGGARCTWRVSPDGRTLTLKDPGFIRRARAEGPVLVHCALGHGRSATFVAAYLLAEGLAASLPEALDLLRRVWPGVRLSDAQRRLLEAGPEAPRPD